MQDTMGRNAAFLLFWGILNSYFPPDCCQTDSTYNPSSSPNLYMTVSQSTATPTMEPPNNTYGISSTGSAKTASLDTSETSETSTHTLSHMDDPITTTGFNSQDDTDQTSDSNISSSWTTGTLTDTQNPEPTTETSTSRSVIEQTTFSESTTTACTTTPDSSSAILTKTSEPNRSITQSTTESYPTIHRSQTPVTVFRASTSITTPTLGTVSRQAVTPDSKSTSMNSPSMFPITQENQQTTTNTSLNQFSPPSPLTAIRNDSQPVTTPLAYEHGGSTWGISAQTALNRSDSEGITDTWSNNITSIAAGLKNPPLSNNTSREGNADNSVKSVKSTIVFVFSTPKAPVFKTITFNHPLVNQVTVINTVSGP
ncbi:hypothetical protein H4Q32_028168 [Labeo rohita]|uniref:Mucin-5AC-like n=1 Tax=Labeo rohita TaxID=84645 RepID=A0ABQ8MJU7_LABRO|nr:mucin-3A [Labeo rohita]XP_050971619.1 mucin-3A [Labeo rohita]KAI2663125.1 hypothetical protein H4Q32_028168 [Labeo rohita]